MNKRRVATLALVAAAVGGLLLSSGALQVNVTLDDNAAEAIDLFGRSEEPEAPPAEAFWDDGAGATAAEAPGGAPPSFADLTARVSPSVVNIQTSRTVGGAKGGGPRHPLEEFFGPRFQPFGEQKVPSLGTGSKVATADCDAMAIAFADVSGAAILACTDGTARVFDVDDGVMRVLR